MLYRALCGAFVVVTLTEPVRAQMQDDAQPIAQADEQDLRAKQLFAAGAAAFTAQRYGEARDLFEHAYGLSGRKALLYNIGLAADLQGDSKAALVAYEQYLVAEPQGKRVEEVQRRVRALRQAEQRGGAFGPRAAAQAGLEADEAAARTRAERDGAASSVAQKWWFWAAIGSVSVVLVGAVVLAALPDDGEQAAGLPPTSTGLDIAALSRR